MSKKKRGSHYPGKRGSMKAALELNKHINLEIGSARRGYIEDPDSPLFSRRPEVPKDCVAKYPVKVFVLDVFPNALSLSHGLKKRIVEFYFPDHDVAFNLQHGGTAFRLSGGEAEIRYGMDSKAQLIGLCDFPEDLFKKVMALIEAKENVALARDWASAALKNMEDAF